MVPRTPLSRLQRGIVWCCWLGGGLLRLVYLLAIHPPQKHVYSDMAGYLHRAQALIGGHVDGIADSLYPPGASWLFAALLALDGDGGLLSIVQWLLSLATMAGVWTLARRLYGNRVAVLSLVVVTLYLPLFHYAGLFLAENPFTCALLWAYVLLLKAIDAPVPAATALWALAAGLVAGIAAAFKATILLPVLVTGVVLLAWMATQRRRGALTLVIGVGLGLATVLLPLAERCTRLAEGRFCLVSTNTAMNALMGHAGEKAEFRWFDGARQMTFSFTSPSASLRGYRERVDLNFGAYDVPANLAELHRRIEADPQMALASSLRNVADLAVGRDFWPGAVYGTRNWGRGYQNLYKWVLLPLALLWLIWRAPRMLRFKPDSLSEWLLLAPLAGLAATAFISLGEVRFRIPFDGFVIILAAQALLAIVDHRQRRIGISAPPLPVLPRRP